MHAQAEFGHLFDRIECKVRHADQVQVGALDAEDAVAREVDAVHVYAHRLVADLVAEAQAPILQRKLEEVARDVIAMPRVQPLHRDGGHRSHGA